MQEDLKSSSLKSMEMALELDSSMIIYYKQELDSPEDEYYDFILTLYNLLVVNGDFVSGDPVATILNSF